MSDQTEKQNDFHEKHYDLSSLQMNRRQNRNPYASNYAEENAESRTHASARIRANAGTNTIQRRVRKKQPSFKFNWGLLVFALVIAAVIIFSIVQIASKPATDPSNTPTPPPITGGDTDDQTSSDDPSQPDMDEDGNSPPSVSSVADCKSFDVKMSPDKEDDGLLILVNYQYDYADADNVETVNTYNSRTAGFKVANTGIELSKVAFDAFEEMVNGLNDATGCGDVIINSGYRTYEDQVDIYDYYVEAKGEDYAKDYVANPGQSEHHTGLACDLSFYLDAGYSEPVGKHEHGGWLSEHCTDYGFIIRYPESKVKYTHIAYEAWHFRYVGLTHAKAMYALDMCLEEYVEYLTKYTLDKKLMFVSSDGKVTDVPADKLPSGGGVLVYYVPVTKKGDTTVTVLGTENSDSYTISGTNTGGYVVTVKVNSELFK